MRTVMTELVIDVEKYLNEGRSHNNVIEIVSEYYEISYEDAVKLVEPIVELHKEVVGLWS